MYVAQNLAKRWAMAGGKENLDACAKLLGLAKRNEDRALVIEGIASAFEGGKIPELPPSLADAMSAYMKSQMDNDLALAVKTGSADAVTKALAIVNDRKASSTKRASLLQALAEAGDRQVVPAIISILGTAGEVGLKKAALGVAGRFDDEKIAKAVVAGYEGRLAGDASLRDATHRMLAGRLGWARIFMDEVEAFHIKTRHVSPDVVRQLGLYHDAALDERVKKFWPPASAKVGSAQKLAEMKRIKDVIAAGKGDADKGKVIYQRCAVCHTLFGEGGKVGPELTGYDRNNPDFWLLAILDPSIEIREGFGAYVCKLKDGQVLMGVLDKQDAGGIVLKDIAAQKHSVKQSDIVSLEASPISLMPEGQLTGLSDTELRDFFAYLMKP
jgi:putative heme-binding domain-containing protein